MTKEAQAIEVEILEIDGAAPTQKVQAERVPAAEQPWKNWQGRVRHLDSRWWPVWIFLGVIAVALALTVGLVLGIVFLVFRIVRGVFRALVG